jgi:hypothetical protein
MLASLKFVEPTLQAYLIDNKIVNTTLYLFLILYASLAAPQLPRVVADLFNYPLFRLAVLFGLAFLASKDATAAILAAIGVTITMFTLNKYKINDMLNSVTRQVKEKFDALEETQYVYSEEPALENFEDHVDHFDQDLAGVEHFAEYEAAATEEAAPAEDPAAYFHEDGEFQEPFDGEEYAQF